MRKTKTLCAVLLATTTLLCGAAHAESNYSFQEGWVSDDERSSSKGFDYNGHYVILGEDNSKVEISYLFDDFYDQVYGNPEQNQHGETILFQGWKDEGDWRSVHGYAAVFSRCAGKTIPITYHVSGHFNVYRTLLTLKGTAPVVNPRTCAIRWRNANLVFNADNRPVVE